MNLNNTTTKNKIKTADVAFMLILAFLTAFSIWKAPYGYINNDEPFYLTIPYRMVQGDSLLINEWHVSQLSAVLLYPVMKLYLLITDSTDGIVLSFRYIYIAVQFTAAVGIYLCMRKYGGKAKLGAIAAVCVFAPFTPYYIGALSYNSMGILALTLSGFVLATASYKIHKLVIGGCFTLLPCCAAHI